MIFNLTRLLTIVPLFAIGLVLSPINFTQAEGFESLHNGRDLAGWNGDPNIWSVEDGAITGITTAENPLKNNTFIIWKGKPLANFRLELQYRLVGGNSGIQYRSKVVDPKKWIVGGYQADFEAGTTYSGILYEEKGRGVLALRGERVTIDSDGKKNAQAVTDSKKLQKHIRQEDWNDYVIEARGNVLKHTINGHLMSETIDGETKKSSSSGVLALQAHQGPPMKVQFRKIRLKRYDD